MENELLKAIFDSALDGIFIIDLEGRYIDVNPAGCAMFGYSKEEMLAGDIRLLLFPEDAQAAFDRGKKSWREGAFVPEFRMRRKDGSEVWVELTVKPLKTKRGDLVLGIKRDITWRKRAALDEKRKTTDLLRAIVDNTMAVIFLKDGDGRHIHVNRSFEEVFRLPGGTALNRTNHEIFPKEIADAIQENDRKVRESSSPLVFEEDILHADGTPHTYLTVKFTIPSIPGSVCGIATDITERKMIDRELLKAKKLESIGVLAGGIAHDFNNLLSGIIGNVSVAKALTGADGKVHSLLGEIEKAALRSKDLTKQLLTFSRGGEPIRERVDIAQLVEDSARLVLRETGVQCSFSFQQGLKEAEADPGQLSQVMNNIVLNAAQAMGNDGRMEVKAGNVTVGANGPLPLKEGDYVLVSIIDHGPGIPKKVLGRVFDPFFTTKERASGLGLAISYSIVKKHGGAIIAESSKDGATFSVYLPVAAKKAEARPVSDTIVRGSGRILVMDDEELVRDTTASMLELLGYDAAFAEDGARAVELYKEAIRDSAPFEAVILDLTVPNGMGGLDTLHELLKIDPRVKAIVSSGYSKAPVMSDYRKHGFSGVITKPYRVGEFGRALKAVLAK